MKTIFFLLLFCICTSSLCIFIKDCMSPGMIFRRYFLLLKYHWVKNWRKKDKWKRPFLKIIGFCIFCNAVYVGLGCLIILNISLINLSIVNLTLISPLFLGIQHILIKVLLKIK